MSQSKTDTKKKKTTTNKRRYTQAPMTIDPGVLCVHCGARYGHTITNTYKNGRRRRICGSCGKPFVSRILESANRGKDVTL